jgi:hypothetical protein
MNLQQLENDIDDALTVINVGKTPNEREALRRRVYEKSYAFLQAIQRDMLKRNEGTSSQGTALARLCSDMNTAHSKFMPLVAPGQSKSTF